MTLTQHSDLDFIAGFSLGDSHRVIPHEEHIIPLDIIAIISSHTPRRVIILRDQ